MMMGNCRGITAAIPRDEAEEAEEDDEVEDDEDEEEDAAPAPAFAGMAGAGRGLDGNAGAPPVDVAVASDVAAAGSAVDRVSD